METLIYLVAIVFGILSLILFFKVWGMCNRVAEIQENLAEYTKTKHYDHFSNNSVEALMADARYAKELAACGKMEEARCQLKRIQYHIEEDEKRLAKRVNDVGYFMKGKREIVKELREYLDNLS